MKTKLYVLCHPDGSAVADYSLAPSLKPDHDVRCLHFSERPDAPFPTTCRYRAAFVWKPAAQVLPRLLADSR